MATFVRDAATWPLSAEMEEALDRCRDVLYESRMQRASEKMMDRMFCVCVDHSGDGVNDKCPYCHGRGVLEK